MKISRQSIDKGTAEISRFLQRDWLSMGKTQLSLVELTGNTKQAYLLPLLENNLNIIDMLRKRSTRINIVSLNEIILLYCTIQIHRYTTPKNVSDYFL
jgi:hypothetical protein